METKLLFTLLIAACFPTGSHQNLNSLNCPGGFRDANYLVVSEVSENARFSTQSGTYDELDRQIGLFFADVVVTGTNAQADVGYFSDSYADLIVNGNLINGFLWREPHWRNPVVLSNGNLPAREPNAGATPLIGLQSIYNYRTSLRPAAGRRTILPVIYASMIRTTDNNDIQDISNLLQLFANDGIDVYLFAVGSAVSDSNLDSLKTRLFGVLGRAAVFNVAATESVAGLGQLITDQVIQCATVTPAPPTPAPTPSPPTALSQCEACLILESSGLTNHPDRCDQYLHCMRDLAGTITWVTKQCRRGTLFDKELHVCEHDYKVLNKDRALTGCQWCSTPGQRHPFQDSCGAYLTCQRDANNQNFLPMSPACCSPNQYFDGSNCVGVAGSIGITSQCRDRRLRGHMYKHAVACRTYYSCSTGGTDFQENCCPSGTGFNQTSQLCENRSGCNRGCLDPAEWECNKEAVGTCSFRTIYRGLNPTATYATLPCPDGTYYSTTICDCVSDNKDLIAQCDIQLGRSILNCKKDVVINNGTKTKSWGFSESSGKHHYVNLKGSPIFSNSPQKMLLDGTTDYAMLPYYAANSQGFRGNTVLFRVNVKDDTTNGPLDKEMIILSNHPCQDTSSDAGDQASVFITMQPSTGAVVFGVRTIKGQTWGPNVTLNYPPTATFTNAWKEVTLRYNQLTGLLEANLRVYNYDQSGDKIYVEPPRDGTAQGTGGKILTSSCALKIGKGADNNPNLFQGYVDNVTFYTSCKKTDPPAANAQF